LDILNRLKKFQFFFKSRAQQLNMGQLSPPQCTSIQPPLVDYYYYYYYYYYYQNNANIFVTWRLRWRFLTSAHDV